MVAEIFHFRVWTIYLLTHTHTDRHKHRQTHKETDTHTDRHTHRQISDCSSSLASAEIEILLEMGNQPRFGGSGKIDWARLTETPPSRYNV